jgi:hypothetical protein
MKKNVCWMIAVMLCFLVSSCKQSEKQPEQLFNGRDLSGWKFVVDGDKVPASEVYMVRDGVIHIHGDPFGFMYTEKKYKDYTLELEWRWAGEASNSGIFLIINDPQPGNAFPNSIECQLRAGLAGDFVLLGGSDLIEYVAPESGRPAFPVVRKREASSEKPVGEWNKAKIEVVDGKITVYINDVFQNQGTSPLKEGHIGLQSEGLPIQFRNLTVVEK